MLAVVPVFILFSPVRYYLKEVTKCVGKVPFKDRSPAQKLAHLSPEQSYSFLYTQDQYGEQIHFR